MPSLRATLVLGSLLVTGCGHDRVASTAVQAARSDPVDMVAVRAGIVACPVPLTDAALDDLETYDWCWLAPDLERLVRNDYADDELELPDLVALQRHAGAIPRWMFETQLRRFVDPGDALAGSMAIEEARGLLPDPVIAPEVVVPFAPEPAVEPAPCTGPQCAGRLLPPPHPDRPFRPERRAELAAMRTRDRPLAGVRVGIDPGHAGGRYGTFEERRLTKTRAAGKPTIVLQEGDLTLRTALELRSRLEALGAQVVMTRDRPGFVHPYPLHALRPAAERLLRRLSLDPRYVAVERNLTRSERVRLRTAVGIFAVRRQNAFEGLRWRARLLASGRPDLVISIHFNAEPTAAPQRSEEVVAMIAGAHDARRLYNPYHRWRALEQAFAVEDFDASAHLGALCVRRMSEFLELDMDRGERYPDHVPIRDQAGRPVGVSAWNGALLRYLDGVAVLTEGPFVDDPRELRRLWDALAAPEGTRGTRTEQYSAALAACIEDFVGRWLDSPANPFGGEFDGRERAPTSRRGARTDDGHVAR